MIRVPCSKCGCVDYPKYRQRYRKENGWYHWMASYCVRCQREESNERRRQPGQYEKVLNQVKDWRLNNLERYRKRTAKYMKEWRKRNRKKWLCYQRNRYHEILKHNKKPIIKIKKVFVTRHVSPKKTHWWKLDKNINKKTEYRLLTDGVSTY